jgi:pyruvate dehydrogenase E1 component
VRRFRADAGHGVIREEGVERAQYLIDQLLSEARKGGVKVAAGAGTANNTWNFGVQVEAWW